MCEMPGVCNGIKSLRKLIKPLECIRISLVYISLMAIEGSHLDKVMPSRVGGGTASAHIRSVVTRHLRNISNGHGVYCGTEHLSSLKLRLESGRHSRRRNCQKRSVAIC